MPRKPANKRKRIFTLAILVFISVTFLSGLAVFKSINKPFASAESSTSFDINNSDLSTLLLITVENIEEETPKTTSLDLIIFDKNKKKVVSFNIPLDWQVDVPGKYADNKLSKVLPIAMMNAKTNHEAVEVLRDSIENEFAFNIDRYVLMDEKISTPILETFKEGKSGGLLGYKNLTNLALFVESNASLSEFYNFYSFVNGLPLDRFVNYNESAQVLDESELIQTVIRDLTFDSVVATEGSSVAVLNGTDIPGVATFSSNVVKNYGGHVTEVANADEKYDESILVVSSKDLAVVKQIQRFFNVTKVVLKEDFRQDSFVVNRADVSLIVGLDTAESL